jgi:hypothetical protein
MKDTSLPRCSAVIPLDNENGIECNGPTSLLCEEGPRCAECFALYGGTPVTAEPATIQPVRFDLGSLMVSVIDGLRA